MFELLLKASLAIAIAFLFYKIVLQQESFFATNRLYLIGCLALAFVLPFITLPKIISQQGILSEVFEQKVIIEEQAFKNSSEGSFSATPVPVLETPSEEIPEQTSVTSSEAISEKTSEIIPVEKNLIPSTEIIGNTEEFLPASKPSAEIMEAPQYSLMFWITALYLFGVAVFGISLLFQLGYIGYQIVTSPEKIRDGAYVIVNTARSKAPCSFFNYIFIYPDDYDFETYEQIIAHEKTHVRLGHSFDLLFAELAVIALWFNPFVWFLKREIEKNNEYQTDSILVEQEQVRKEQYQLNLLQIAVPNKPLNITTNYNQSLIKQRIVMMNSKRSTPNAYWKYAFMLPLFLGILLLMNEPATAQEQQEKSKTEVKDSIKRANENTKKDVVKKQEGQRENEKLVERKETLQREQEETVKREREELVDRTAVRERLEERVEVAQNRQEITRQRLVERTALLNRRSNAVNGRLPQEDMTKGVWYSRTKSGSYCIDFKGGEDNSRWNMSDCFNTSAFEKKSTDRFVMTNEVGTLELTGNLDAEVGQGKYSFTENSSFRDLIARNNVAGVSANHMFHLFLGDFTGDYVQYLKQQYPDVDGDNLSALAIHGVKQKDFQNYVSLFEGHTSEKAGIDDVVALRIHRVTEDYIRELQEMGFSNLSMDKIMAAKIHGITAEYSRDLRNAGFSDLSIDDIISAKIHRVTPETIKEMRTLGAKDLDEIISLQIHRVTPAYVQELQSAGLEQLSSLNDVLSAKIHGLNAASIKELKALGFENLDFDDLLSAKIHRVDAAFVKDLERVGFTNLDMNKIVSARIHGIDGDFIEKARKDGYDLNSIDKYISLKIHGSALESLKDN